MLCRGFSTCFLSMGACASPRARASAPARARARARLRASARVRAFTCARGCGCACPCAQACVRASLRVCETARERRPATLKKRPRPESSSSLAAGHTTRFALVRPLGPRRGTAPQRPRAPRERPATAGARASGRRKRPPRKKTRSSEATACQAAAEQLQENDSSQTRGPRKGGSCRTRGPQPRALSRWRRRG